MNKVKEVSEADLEIDLLRVINRELMQHSYDCVCYREAHRRSKVSNKSTTEWYTLLRLNALKALNMRASPNRPHTASFMSTDQCHQHISRRSRERENKSPKHRAKFLQQIEQWISSVVLLVGSVSAAFCVWSHTGNALPHFPYLSILGVIAVIQLLPWLIAKFNFCSQLSATSALCILVALISFGSGVKLLKSNPRIKIKEKVQEEKLVHTIIIKPAENATSFDPNKVSWNQN